MQLSGNYKGNACRNATIKQLQSHILLSTKGQYMRDLDSLGGNATVKQVLREILCCLKVHYKKNSIIHGGNATIRQLQGEVLCRTKGQDKTRKDIYFSKRTCIFK